MMVKKWIQIQIILKMIKRDNNMMNRKKMLKILIRMQVRIKTMMMRQDMMTKFKLKKNHINFKLFKIKIRVLVNIKILEMLINLETKLSLITSMGFKLWLLLETKQLIRLIIVNCGHKVQKHKLKMFNLKGGVNLKMLMLYSPHNSNS